MSIKNCKSKVSVTLLIEYEDALMVQPSIEVSKTWLAV